MTQKTDPIVISSYARTPIGGFMGVFSDLSAPQLGAIAIRAALERAKLSANALDEIIIGNVLSAGQGQAPARQAALGAGVPDSVGCTTINKMCGSGLKAVMLAHDLIAAGTNDIMIAGGMESMTNAPHLLPRLRPGIRMGPAVVQDHMFLDGLEDAYDRGKLMGRFAENCAADYGFTRDQQDHFALESLSRAQRTDFSSEIIPVTVTLKKDTRIIDRDEQPQNAKPDKIPTLKPAFKENGTVTAANSSSISDGAAALIITRRSIAEKMDLPIYAAMMGHVTHAQKPSLFTTAPVGALKKLSNKIGWNLDAVDLFEINEAFAVVTMAAMKDLNLPHDKVNVHGGACALGHPIGASGARVLVTLLAALEKYDLKRGMATLCIGGGEAVAVAVER